MNPQPSQAENLLILLCCFEVLSISLLFGLFVSKIITFLTTRK